MTAIGILVETPQNGCRDEAMRKNERIKTEVVIIGAGPVGLFAAFQCGMNGLSCHVIDALDTVGGQCAVLYPDKPIYDIPGFAEITGAELVGNLRRQAEPFGPHYHLADTVTELKGQVEGRWLVRTAQGRAFDAGAVIIAAGLGAFEPKRPPLEGIRVYENAGSGRGVKYNIRGGDAYEGRDVVIAGAGDAAVDAAIELAPQARSVALVHRRDTFRTTQSRLETLMNLTESGKVELVVPYQLEALEGAEGVLSAVLVKNLDGASRKLSADVLLPLFGLSQQLGALAEWGLKIDAKRIESDPSSAKTNLPGVFAIGDIAVYPHKQRLILTGFSEAAFAAEAAYKHIYPGHPFKFRHSTSKGAPGRNEALK